MFIKYISKYGLKVGKYISLAGFSKDFFNKDSDHLVPLELLEEYCKDIESVSIPMKDIGHMGKKKWIRKVAQSIRTNRKVGILQ